MDYQPQLDTKSSKNLGVVATPAAAPAGRSWFGGSKSDAGKKFTSAGLVAQAFVSHKRVNPDNKDL